MNMPGFYAEASLYKRVPCFRIGDAQIFETDIVEIIPASVPNISDFGFNPNLQYIDTKWARCSKWVCTKSIALSDGHGGIYQICAKGAFIIDPSLPGCEQYS